MRRSFYKSYGLYNSQELEEMKKDFKENYTETIENMSEEETNEYIEKAILTYIYEGYEYFINDLLENDLEALECVIKGVLGLWNGKHTIQPVYANLGQCITKCIGDSDEIEIYEEDGELKIDAYHHDGVNRFTINQESGLPLNLMSKMYGA